MLAYVAGPVARSDGCPKDTPGALPPGPHPGVPANEPDCSKFRPPSPPAKPPGPPRASFWGNGAHESLVPPFRSIIPLMTTLFDASQVIGVFAGFFMNP